MITITENANSRQVTAGSSAELLYTIRGTADQSEALAQLLIESPDIFEELPRQSRTIEPVFVDVNNPATCIWSASVKYGRTSASVSGAVYNFDTGGGNQKVTQSINTQGVYPASAPSFFGAIGVDDQNVSGVDIVVPTYNFTETHTLSDAQVNTAYKVTLADLTGSINSAAFKGFAAGEVLFMGASGSKRGSDDWEIVYKFSVSRHRSNFTVGDITVANKRGWDYMWIRYSDEVSDNNLIKKPSGVYVEQVYPYCDFTLLGIGV